MSDTRHQRFELDLDDIERQLRRAVEPVPVAKSDPLAELARIVGQDDPFRDILAPRPAPDGTAEPALRPANGPAPDPRRRVEPVLNAEERAVLHGPAEPAFERSRPAAHGPEPLGGGEPGTAPRPVFDPVADAYGTPENAVDEGDFQPLRPRRSRGRLVAVAALVGVGLAGTAGIVLTRSGSGGGFLATGGAPPVIKADTSPLKVAPENPGGVEIPDQDRQIYDRSAQEAKSRLVDRQEQPVDVREAARALPPVPSLPASPPAEIAPATPPAAGFEPTPTNSVTTALGLPRRVRTVTVRPDGSPFGNGAVPSATGTVTLPDGLPPPVAVPTVSIPAVPPAVVSSLPAVPADGGATGLPPVTVLPPQRPRDLRGAPADAARTPVAARDMAGSSESGLDSAPLPIGPRTQRNAPRVAGAPQPTLSPDQLPPPGASGGYVVNLATRSSETAARSYSGQLASRYAGGLGGRPTTVLREEVDGKSTFRIRVGPVSREEANGLCDRVKAAGGSCSVASGN